MESWPSPGLYFEVMPSQGISDAMNALFKKALAEASITSMKAVEPYARDAKWWSKESHRGTGL